MIGGGDHIDLLVQVGDMPDDLDAAVALDQHVDLGVQRFEGLLQVVEGMIRLPAQKTRKGILSCGAEVAARSSVSGGGVSPGASSLAGALARQLLSRKTSVRYRNARKLITRTGYLASMDAMSFTHNELSMPGITSLNLPGVFVKASRQSVHACRSLTLSSAV